ncbi:MAG: 50S ribosomal protein L32e [Candidatus Thorarchaeota archaeon]|nr:MAG: 50S ribosomal protein L32e [Candidatus Thorarchaeota archaeon]
MSKKPEISDLPGLGPKLEEKLREAGIKTVLNLSRAKADKLAAKVDGLSESRAEILIASAQEALSSTPAPEKEDKPKKTEAKSEKPAVEKPKAKAEAKPKTAKETVETTEPKTKPKPKKAAKETVETTEPKTKPKPKKAAKKKVEAPARFLNIDQRLVRITNATKKRKPRFRADQAHRWIRISDRWRKVRGIDSYTRQKKKGRIAMVESGYRTPKAIRYLHPSLFKEVLVFRPADLEGLDADIYAVRISAGVGGRKRQLILAEADAKLLKVLNPGTTEEIGEEDLFTDLDLEED